MSTREVLRLVIPAALIGIVLGIFTLPQGQPDKRAVRDIYVTVPTGEISFAVINPGAVLITVTEPSGKKQYAHVQLHAGAYAEPSANGTVSLNSQNKGRAILSNKEHDIIVLLRYANLYDGAHRYALEKDKPRVHLRWTEDKRDSSTPARAHTTA